MDMEFHSDQSQPKSFQNIRKCGADPSSSLHTIHRKISKRWIFQAGGLAEGTKLYYKSHGEILLEGRKKGLGILCLCCKKEMSPSQFEEHAGFGSRKKPYDHIYISDELSLDQYASNINPDCENDAQCGVSCPKGGNLLHCGGCCRPIHQECLSETKIPQNKLLCDSCRRSKRNVGQNSAKKIAGHCSLIADIPQNSYRVACVLCRETDFTENRFDDRTSIICEQCEKEYHIGCLKHHWKAFLKELPKGNWYCTKRCHKLHRELEILVKCGPEKLPKCLLSLVQMKMNDGDADGITNRDVRFVIVRGKDEKASENNRLLLAEAVKIFHYRFNKIVDSETKEDYIDTMAYGLTMGSNRHFSGVHTAIMTIDSKVAIAGMFRVFGETAAELSIVATSETYQGKGYFSLFFNCFEKLLSHLNIKKLVIPATSAARKMWIEKFGLKQLSREQRKEYRDTQPSMVEFQGTTLLEKTVPKVCATYIDCAIFTLDLDQSSAE